MHHTQAEARTYSADRYSCESVFGRVTRASALLRDRVARRHFAYLNDAWLVAHARANQMKLIRKRKDAPEGWFTFDWDAAPGELATH